MRRLAPLLLLVTLVVSGATGCGVSRGSGASGTSDASSGPGSTATTTTSRPETSDDSRAAYSVAWSDEYVDIDQDDRCLSGRLVDLFGVDYLNEAGVTAEAFATEEVLTALEVDESERPALAIDVGAAIAACNVAERLATEWLSSDDEVEDLTEFAACVAQPLVPLLADIVVQGWSGTPPDSVYDAVSEALEVADAGCPEVQVEVIARALADDGAPLTEEEHTCLLEEYGALADEHRAVTPADDDEVADTCFTA